MPPSKLIFNPSTGLLAPETADIRSGVAEDWRRAFFDPDLPPLDTESSTPAGQLIDAETAEIEAKNAELLFLANQFNPHVAEGRWQDALGYIYFLQRKIDEPTVVSCRLRGRKGTVVPYGALVKSLNGYTLICNRSATIGADGISETTFRLAETGPIEIPPHAVNSIITVIPGWDTVDNEAAGAVGRDLETRSEFEARRYASVAANAHGSTGALFGIIANLPGVLDAAVLENIGPDPVKKFGVTVPGHGITVCVYGGNDDDIAEVIYRKKDNGCATGGNSAVSYKAADYHNAVYNYHIERPATVNFWIKVSLGPDQNITSAHIKALKETLYQDFYGLNTKSGHSRVGLASTVYASRFYCPALSVAGIENVQSIKIALCNNQPTTLDFKDVLTINGNQEPVTSTENIYVE